ncbi:MAG: alpha/beta hydrolase [Clostridia bacterium]|nr:alpha/beta hydrolase [Clostridia bacterium]
MEFSGILYASQNKYDVVYTHDVVFAHRETGDLKMQILTPARPNLPDEHKHALFTMLKKEKKLPERKPEPETRRFPLIVDVPGSGWSGATGYVHVPNMIDLARAGYVVASIEYRGTFKDDVRFPAAVQDCKEAVRFLRAHADEYLVDVNRIALLGDSSGGHTVAMAALTGDEERFNIGDHLDQPTKVNSCVIFYGPNDLEHLVADRKAEGKRLRPGEDPWPFEGKEIFHFDFDNDPETYLADASATNYIAPGKPMPAFLFLNGDQDPIIPLRQGDRFCKKVRECGGRAEFYKIVGGGHGNGCWTEDAMALVKKFLDATV